MERIKRWMRDGDQDKALAFSWIKLSQWLTIAILCIYGTMELTNVHAGHIVYLPSSIGIICSLWKFNFWTKVLFRVAFK